jgi:hypothetical protein
MGLAPSGASAPAWVGVGFSYLMPVMAMPWVKKR